MNKNLTVSQFFKNIQSRISLKIVAGDNFTDQKNIVTAGLNKPGLALSGYFKDFNWKCLQLLTATEISFINDQFQINNTKDIKKLCEFGIPAFIIQGKKRINPKFIEECIFRKIPVFRCPKTSSKLYLETTEYLDDFFAPSTQIHGTLVDVYGTGLLIMGRSSIGKSEIALDLVERGHRLVADDVVTIQKKGENVLMGKSGGEYTQFMEIRGLGILNVKEIFGTRAIRVQKRVELVIQLQDWKKELEYERLGIEDDNIKILGVEIPRVKLPIFPGKNITVIAETIALNLHLKVYGYNAAKEFNKFLMKKMKKQQKLSRYLNKDYE
ncbi:MAG: HPr(Ser) kinase/phosphatase [Candidatus Delongbacteria bacterium]|nr:HPr(Ser) kinase/phosphatase [Candidatus Delongbacteria bacterium]